MKALGVEYEAPRCEQCNREIEDEEKRYECNCGAMLCDNCYSNCKECN